VGGGLLVWGFFFVGGLVVCVVRKKKKGLTTKMPRMLAGTDSSGGEASESWKRVTSKVAESLIDGNRVSKRKGRSTAKEKKEGPVWPLELSISGWRHKKKPIKERIEESAQIQNPRERKRQLRGKEKKRTSITTIEKREKDRV